MEELNEKTIDLERLKVFVAGVSAPGSELREIYPFLHECVKRQLLRDQVHDALVYSTFWYLSYGYTLTYEELTDFLADTKATASDDGQQLHKINNKLLKRLPYNDIKQKLFDNGLLITCQGCAFDANVICIDKTIPNGATSVGALLMNESKSEQAHAEKQCKCYCTCRDCWHQACNKSF